MEQLAQGIIETLSARQQSMIDTLIQWANINSGTTHLNGLAQMCEILSSSFASIADEIEKKALPPVFVINPKGQTVQQEFGDALFIRKRPHLKRRILLCGHMDTVYDCDHPFMTCTQQSANQLNGPGVTDMKGGLLVMLHALLAFEEHCKEAPTLGWDVFINSEEEFSSPASGPILKELAAHYQAALVYEPSITPSGNLAKNRRGSGKFTIMAKGRASHVGRAFAFGRNAICYLAEVVLALDALNGKRDGVDVNVGLISGGEALNMVPALAQAQIDVRISTPEDEIWVTQQLNKLIASLQRPEYSLSLHGHFTRPVKRINPATEGLFKRIQTLGKTLNLSIDWEDSGGCCDGNNLAAQGLAVIDTLGVRGGQIHSPEEYILLDSLAERATLSAFLLSDLSLGGLEELSIC
jgi:glutamate carboxypeptidase